MLIGALAPEAREPLAIHDFLAQDERVVVLLEAPVSVQHRQTSAPLPYG